MRLKALYYFLVLLVGCAQVPRPSTYPYTLQQKMQAADHWRLLASQVTGEVAANLRAWPVPSTGSIYIQCPGSVYVPCSDDQSLFKDTTFGRAFHSFLITEFKNQDILVSFDQQNPLQIEWVVQPVVHNAYRTKPYPTLGEAIIAVPTSLFVDVWNGIAGGPLPHSEIIITTTITDSGAIRWRNAYVFYINDEDWQLYWSRLEAPVKSYAVVDR